MKVPIVFVDANVLYSKTLRDWLFLLREATAAEMFTVASSNDVIAEVLYRVRRNNVAAPGHLTSNIKEVIERSLDELVRDFPGGMVFPGDDAHDVHVHAAAETCGAEYLVTDDEGFARVADELSYEVHTADSFFVLLEENVPHVIDEVMIDQIEYYSTRGDGRTLSDALVAAGCPLFAEIVALKLQAISEGRSTHEIASSVVPLTSPREIAAENIAAR